MKTTRMMARKLIVGLRLSRFVSVSKSARRRVFLTGLLETANRNLLCPFVVALQKVGKVLA
jgi:hypothetical protein